MFFHNTRLSFFACQKDAVGAALKRRHRLRLSTPANKKIGFKLVKLREKKMCSVLKKQFLAFKK